MSDTILILPPDPEEQNDDRAEAAERALLHFAVEYGETNNRMNVDDEDGFEGLAAQNLSDLLCDFAHYCDRQDINFADCLRRAEAHYSEETANEEGLTEGTQTFNASDSTACTAFSPEPPRVLVTISGGMADVAELIGDVRVDLLDYDNLKESLKDGDGLLLSDQVMAYIRANDKPEFIAEVEALREVPA